MSILPEALGHYRGSDDKKNNYTRQEDQRGSNQVSRISEQTAQCSPPFVAAVSSASARAKGLSQVKLSLLRQENDQMIKHD